MLDGRRGVWLGCKEAPAPTQLLPWPLTTEAALQVTDQIVKLAKKGMLPSQIGVVLRDSHGVTQVNAVTGSKILRILKGQGMAPSIPEDLYHLIKKAVSMRKHMEANRKDKDSKFRLILVESRIHRLARYYKVLNSTITQLLAKSCTEISSGRSACISSMRHMSTWGLWQICCCLGALHLQSWTIEMVLNMFLWTAEGKEVAAHLEV